MNASGTVSATALPSTTSRNSRPSVTSVRSTVSAASGDGSSAVGRVHQQASVGGRIGASRLAEGKQKSEIVEGNLQLLDTIDADSEVMCVRYSPDGCLLAAGYSDGIARVYSVESGKCLYAMVPDEPVKLPVTCLRFCPSSAGDNRHSYIATSYASGRVRLWHYSSGQCVSQLDDGRVQTMSLAFNPRGTQFVTVGADPQVFVYDVETRQRISVLDATWRDYRDSRDKMDGHRARVFAVIYHPTEPHVLLTGGWDDTVQYWDDRQRHSFKRFSGPHICGDALDIDPVYNHILTGSWRKDAPLQIWDFPTAEKIKDVPQDIQYTSQLYCAQWLGRDSIVCGGCFGNMARVVDRGTLNTSGQLVQLPQGVYCLDNDRQGARPQLAIGAACRIYLLKPLTPGSSSTTTAVAK